MKRFRRLLMTAAVLLLVLLCCGIAQADDLVLPTNLQSIEEEAFYGDASLDRVILPRGLESIGPRAFADSSVRVIYLPGTLYEVAENAFDGTSLQGVIVDEGSWVSGWAEQQGLPVVYGNEFQSWPWEDQFWVRVNYGETAVMGVDFYAWDADGVRSEWYLVGRNADGTDDWSDVIGEEQWIETAPVTGHLRYVNRMTDAYGNWRDIWFDVMVQNDLQVWSTLPNGRNWLYLNTGETAQLSVDASANDKSVLNYQWYRIGVNEWGDDDWIPLEGETGQSLTTAPFEGYTRYVCRVNDCYDGMEDCWFFLELEPQGNEVTSGAAYDITDTAAWVPLNYSVTEDLVERGYRMGVAYSENAADLAVAPNGRLMCMDWTWGRESNVGGPANNTSYDGWLDELIPGHTYWYAGVLIDNDGQVAFLEETVRRFTTGDGSGVTTLTLENEGYAPRGNAKTPFRFIAPESGWYVLRSGEVYVDEMSARRLDNRGFGWNEHEVNSLNFYADEGETVYLFVRDFGEDAQVWIESLVVPDYDSVESSDASDVLSARAWVDISYAVTPETADRGYRVGIAFSRYPGDLMYFNNQGRFDCAMWDCWGDSEFQLRTDGFVNKLLDELVPNTTYYYRAYVTVDDRIVATEDLNEEPKSFTTRNVADDFLTLEESNGEDLWVAFPSEDKTALCFTALSDGIYRVYTDREVDELLIMNAAGDRLAEARDCVWELYFPAHEGETVYIFVRNWDESGRIALCWHDAFAEADGVFIEFTDGDAIGQTWASFNVGYSVTEETAQYGYQIGVAFSQFENELTVNEDNGRFNCEYWSWDEYWAAANGQSAFRLLDQLIPGRTYYVRAFISVHDRVVEYTDVLSFTTEAAGENQMRLPLDTNMGLPPDQVVVWRFTAEQAGLYELSFSDWIDQIDIRGEDGRKCGSDHGSRGISFYLDEGDTGWFFLRNWNRGLSFRLEYVCGAPEADSVSSEVVFADGYWQVLLTLDICPETADNGYAFGLELSPNANFRNASDVFWRYGDGLVRVDDVEQSGIPAMIPGVTMYYRAYIERFDIDRLYEQEIHSFTPDGDPEDLPELTLGVWTEKETGMETLYRFTAEQAGFYAVEAENMDYFNIIADNGQYVRGTNQIENGDRYAVLAVGFGEGETGYIDLGGPAGTRIRVVEALGAVPSLSEEPYWVWDNRYVSFTAGEAGYYNVQVERPEFGRVMVFPNAYEGYNLYFDYDSNTRTIWLDEEQTVFLITWYNMDEGEQRISVSPVEPPEEDSIFQLSDMQIGDTWATMEFVYSVTEDTWRRTVERRGYQVGVVYSDEEIHVTQDGGWFFGSGEEEFNGMTEDWSWEPLYSIEDSAWVTRTLDRLIPGTSYWYVAYIRDTESGEIYALTAPASFTTNEASENLIALTLGQEVEVPAWENCVYSFTPEQDGMYAVVSRGLDGLDIREGAGHWLAGDDNDDWDDENYPFCQGFVARGGQTYYIFAWNHRENVTLSVQGAEALPELRLDEWTDWYDGRQVFRFTSGDHESIYRFEMDGTDRGELKFSNPSYDYEWVGIDKMNSSVTVRFGAEETCYVGCWFDNDRARVRLYVTEVVPPEQLSIETLDVEDVTDVSARFGVELGVPEYDDGWTYTYGICLLRDDGQDFTGYDAWHETNSDMSMTVWSESAPLENGYRRYFTDRPLEPGRGYWYQAFISVYDPNTNSDEFTWGEMKYFETAPMEHSVTPVTSELTWVDWRQDEDYQFFSFTVPQNAAELYTVAVQDSSIWVIDPDGLCLWPEWAENSLHLEIAGKGHEGQTYTICLKVWDREGTELRVHGLNGVQVGPGPETQLDTWNLYTFIAPAEGEYIIAATDGGRINVFIPEEGGFSHGSGWAWITEGSHEGDELVFRLERDDGAPTAAVKIAPIDPVVTSYAELRQAAAAAASIAQVRPYFDYNIYVDGDITLEQDLELCTAVQLHLRANLTVPSGVTLTNHSDLYIEEGGSLNVQGGTLDLSGVAGEWWASVCVWGGTFTQDGTMWINSDSAIVTIDAFSYESTSAALAAVSGNVPAELSQIHLEVSDDAQMAQALELTESYRYVSVKLIDGYSPSFESISAFPGDDRSHVSASEGAQLVVPAGTELTLSTDLQLDDATLTVNGTLILDGGWLIFSPNEECSVVNNGEIRFTDGTGFTWYGDTDFQNRGILRFEDGSNIRLFTNRNPITQGVIDNAGGTVYIGDLAERSDAISFEGGNVLYTPAAYEG